MGRKNCKTSGGVLLGLDVQWEVPTACYYLVLCSVVLKTIGANCNQLWADQGLQVPPFHGTLQIRVNIH